jgi:RNA polymerase sigma factor (TIGR02999 family)
MTAGAKPDEPPDDVTRLIQDAADGRPGAADRLFPLVYSQLRAIAQQRMAMERPGHTLQATALVHEAFLRLTGGAPRVWNGRSHFFHVAGEAMRHLLIDHARRRDRVKRGGALQRVPLNVLDLAAEQDEGQIVALDGAMRRLEEMDGEAAEVVRLRFYAGLSVEQTAEAMGVSERTVKRDWAFARAWLFKEMEKELSE